MSLHPYPFGLGQDLQERLAQIAGVSLVFQATGQWLLMLAAQREALLEAARRMEDNSGHNAAMQTRLEAGLLTAENPIGPLARALQELHPVVTAVGAAKRDGRPLPPEGQDRPQRAPGLPAARPVRHGGSQPTPTILAHDAP